MNKIYLSFLISSLASFSTLLGLIPSYFKQQENTLISSSLAFSAGVMITISLISLIPEACSYFITGHNNILTFLWILIFVITGIFLSTIIDKKIETYIPNNNLYKLGIMSIIALALHNIPEGITTFVSTTTNIKLGIKLSLAIALHNIPEGISIAIPIYYATKSHFKAFLYTFISGIFELLGAILAYLFLAQNLNNFTLGIILSLTSGIMIYIAIYELIPTSYKYKKTKTSFLAFVFGTIIMFICEKLF